MDVRRIIWSLRAKSDLLSIFDFFKRRNGTKTYSKKLSSNIRKTIRLLPVFPQMGIQTDISGVRVIIHGNYAIFYELHPDTIEIIAIWDCRQNHEKLRL